MKTLKALFKDKNVASIAATSEPAVKKILEHIDFSQAKTIVEYGAGAGPITKALLEKMREDAKLHAFETNEELIEELRKIEDKRLQVVHDSAEQVSKYVKQCDYIISGIPFSFLDEELRLKIVEESHSILGEAFIAYQTTTRLKKDLGAFKEIKDELVAMNLPPLFIMVAKK